LKITIKLFAVLAKSLPEDAVRNVAEIEVPDQATVQDVIHQLELPTEHCHLVLVNGVYIAPSERETHTLKNGQALAIWPPVAGG
jgi:sulfur carrier protein ThiS